jgi:hypothetical protein
MPDFAADAQLLDQSVQGHARPSIDAMKLLPQAIIPSRLDSLDESLDQSDQRPSWARSSLDHPQRLASAYIYRRPLTTCSRHIDGPI